MARGIDAEKVDVVVNLDLPTEKDPTVSAALRTPFRLQSHGRKPTCTVLGGQPVSAQWAGWFP